MGDPVCGAAGREPKRLMLITCPSCANTYDLPVDRIGPSGRKVRCAACRESWFVASVEDKPAAMPSLEIEPTESAEIISRPLLEPEAPAKADHRAGASPRSRGSKVPGRLVSRLRPLGRIAAIAFVVATLPGLLAFREKIVGTLPGTASLYRSIGLPVNLVGLNFAGVRSTMSPEGEAPVLEVTGEIVNDGRMPRPVPLLEITLEGEKGERLYRWSAKAAQGELQVGQSAPFRVRLTSPPPGARSVEVTFRDRGRRAASDD